MAKLHMLLIYNPKAGKGLFLQSLGETIDKFVKAGYKVEVYPTQGIGDATLKIARVPGYIDLIVAAGGDGTLDEVITGIVLSGRDVPIGYIPSLSVLPMITRPVSLFRPRFRRRWTVSCTEVRRQSIWEHSTMTLSFM